MSLLEVAFRVEQKLRNETEKAVFRGGKGFRAEASTDPISLINIDLSGTDTESLLLRADRICEDRLDIFALKNVDIGSPVDYHEDPKTGLSSPRDMFGKSIDYRDSGKIGDIKYIWEINRHLFLFVLACAFSVSGDRKYLEKFGYFLTEWLGQNTFMMGVNWESPLETGIRLINWSLAWPLVEREMEEGLRDEWLDSVFRHCWFIGKNFSRFSSANNHLIGEAAGLFMACTAMPGCHKTGEWREKAYRVLERECLKQNFIDGVNKEQAVSYQQFVLDFLLLSGLLGRASGRDFSDEYWNRIENMMEVIASLEDIGGNLPQIGDEDDGLVFDLGQTKYGIYRSLLNTGAFLFRREEFLKAPEGPPPEGDIKTGLYRCLAGNKPLRETGRGPVPTSFPEGGYYTLGKDTGKSSEQKLVFDCGPLGYLSIAAHGHADALSFTLSVGGIPVFIDPGTYAYHADKEWRDYFRGTTAHNTICVDGKDQSENLGPFMWGRKAKAGILEYDCPDRVKGYHDGYDGPGSGVRHEREIISRSAAGSWEIIDTLTCDGPHDIEMYFHFAPECEALLSEGKCHITREGIRCEVSMEDNMSVSLHRGEVSPILGWYSPSYDVKIPAYAIKASRRIKGVTKLITKIVVSV